jgi:acyl carrier protein
VTSDATFDDFVIFAIAMACQCDPTLISPESSIAELRIDSVKMVSIIGQVEASFGLEVSTEQMLDLFLTEQVRDFIALLKTSGCHIA